MRKNGNIADLPVLDIWGQLIKDIKGYEVKECGHYLLEEKTKEVARYILTFGENISIVIK